VVTVDCTKLRKLLGDCQLTPAALEKILNQGQGHMTHSVLHRMLGGARRSGKPYSNANIENVQAVLGVARRILKRPDLPVEEILWLGREASGASTSATEEFDLLLEGAIRTHRRAMADRRLAYKQYGQALCPLGQEAALVVTRDRSLQELDEAERVTAPVRRVGTSDTFVREAPIVVLGEEGVGKTWLVAQWWLTRHPETLLVFLPGPRFRGAETDATRILTDALLLLEPGRARDSENAKRQSLESDDFAAAAQGHVLIVVDGLNEAPDTNWQLVVEALWQTAIRWGARLLLTSRPEFWKRRRRDIALWDCPAPTEVPLRGFDLDELARACALAGRDPSAIPSHLRDRLCNPRIFRLAISLLPNLRSEADLSIDRLLYAYWEQRLRDRPDLAKLDPDRDVLLRGLAHHAEEFHRHRLEAARERGKDLAADAIGYNFDDLHKRFPGLSRYGGLDGETAGPLIGEIREGRFFDDDAMAPPAGYVFRKESLAFALGLYLVEALAEMLRGQRSRLTLEHLRERLDALLGPVLEFDQTADQVMAGLTVACRDPNVHRLVAAALLDQFLTLRNRPPRMKAVMGGLAVETPSVFCDAAERAAGLDDPERVDTWLTTALRDMVTAGAGYDACRSWIVSPTEDEQPLPGRGYAVISDAAWARRREKLAVMVLANQNLKPFSGAFLDWSVLATARQPFGRPDKLRIPLARTFVAQLIRSNDRDPEGLTNSVLDLQEAGTPARRRVRDRAIAVLLALIASPTAVSEAEKIWPGVCALVDPIEELPQPDWHSALDPEADPAHLLALLEEARTAASGRNVDPYRPEGEALRGLAARCDPDFYLTLVRATLKSLIEAGPDGSPDFADISKSLMWLAVESTSALGADEYITVERMQGMLGISGGSRVRVRRDADEELGQVVSSLEAIVSDSGCGHLLLSVPWKPVRRGDGIPVREFWHPVLSASLALDVVVRALSSLAEGGSSSDRAEYALLDAVGRHGIGRPTADELNPLTDLILSSEPSLADVQTSVFEIVSRVDGTQPASRIAESGWTVSADTDFPLGRKLSGFLAEKLCGLLPLGELARIVHRMDLPKAAHGVADDEIAILSKLIGQALEQDRSGSPLPPTAEGARRLVESGEGWIEAHVRWHIWYLSVLIEGLAPSIDPFLAALLTFGRKSVPGGADYLLELLKRARPSLDGATSLLIKAVLAVSFQEPHRRRELLDNVVLRITDDRVLAIVAKNAREHGPDNLVMLAQYCDELLTSGRAVRMAYGILLSALLERDPLQGHEGSSYLGKVSSYAKGALKKHRAALHWAGRRLSAKDIGAEHLALCSASAPFPGALGDQGLATGDDRLDDLFVFRFRQTADRWGFNSLFGFPAGPKWLFPMKPEF
jgi:hypothetical protein